MHFARMAAGLLAVALPAAANDTLETLGAGGLTPLKSSTIVMESEDLAVSIHKISIRYIFRNTADHDQDVIVAFPLPELSGGLLANSPVTIPSKDPVNFVDFRVLAAGQPITPKVETRAFIEISSKTTEVTADLRALGIPASPLDPGVTAAFRKAPAAARARFQKNGWIDCDSSSDGKCWPMWQVRVQFYWTQHFPAKSTVEVQHTYSPIVGGSYLTSSMDGASNLQPYCGSPDALRQVKQLKALHPARNNDSPALLERRIQYILTTANNWSGPIRAFHLSVLPDAPTDIVATCMPGLKRAAPNRYELTLENFHPDKELEVLILQPAH